ncbi:MAG: hypothetical protein H6698_03585 [Myxococcales bacterium]|nr:hypothetical protein [Myxococcales bacterium]MCB9533395.1 hypothetical protein [Myxococcales bacterium]
MLANRRDRLDRLAQWSSARDALTIAIASRPGAHAGLGDTVRSVYEHLRDLPRRPVDRIDVILVGAALPVRVAARTAALLREFGRELTVVAAGVLGPGESLAAVAADSLMLHPLASLSSVVDARGVTGDALRTLAHATTPDEAHALVLALVGSGRSPDDTVGSARHELAWTRHELARLATLRIVPPAAETTAALVAALTRDALSADDVLDRRACRSLGGLPVQHPTPDLESMAFDLVTAYEEHLHAPGGPAAVIESVDAAHALTQASGEALPRWERRHEEPVH